MRILSQNLAHGMLAWMPTEERRRKMIESLETLSLYLAESPMDVVCVQELASDSAFALPEMMHVHRVSARGMDVAICSRLPLFDRGGSMFPKSGVGKAVAWASVDGGARQIRVGSMHLAVLSPFARRRQLMHAMSVANAGATPVFLVGDTNEPRPRVFEAWARPLGLRTSEPGATFPSGAPALRLDRALLTQGVRVLESSVHHTRMSDHCAVAFEVTTG